MRTNELIDALKKYPPDATVEISVPLDINEVVWYDIKAAEAPQEHESHDHCLIYAGVIVMS